MTCPGCGRDRRLDGRYGFLYIAAGAAAGQPYQLCRPCCKEATSPIEAQRLALFDRVEFFFAPVRGAA